jgi:hypothetical protein
LTGDPREDEPLVWARRHHNDWRQAAYRLSEISDIQWDDDGAGQLTTYLCGYVWCHAKLEGERLHPCREDADPHRIKVCITKKDNEEVFGRLAELARTRPR